MWAHLRWLFQCSFPHSCCVVVVGTHFINCFYNHVLNTAKLSSQTEDEVALLISFFSSTISSAARLTETNSKKMKIRGGKWIDRRVDHFIESLSQKRPARTAKRRNENAREWPRNKQTRLYKGRDPESFTSIFHLFPEIFKPWYSWRTFSFYPTLINFTFSYFFNTFLYGKYRFATLFVSNNTESCSFIEKLESTQVN